jgi:hypothetical protein
VRAGHMIGTTGPYIDFSIEESGGGASAGLGETLVPGSADVVLKIRVQAANWIPVEEVRVIANGFEIMSFDATTSPAVKPAPHNPRSQRCREPRFDVEIPITVAGDTYFIVEAGAALSPFPSSPEFVDTIVPGMVPLGFTNPVFVDLGGDGFDPPGLPVMASATGAGEPLPAFARVRRRDLTWFARAGDWWDRVLARLAASSEATADDEQVVLTGRAHRAEVDRQRMTPTAEYFPLYHFTIPPAAVEEALDRLPEPDRSRIRAQRQRADS